ncbi:MAG: IS1595 family transposase [Pseudomonadota bacterium]
MAQHFLHSPAAKTLSLTSVLRMSDEDARAIFAKIRWSETGGEPICPTCGCVEHYDLKSRPVWKCKGCGKQFSLTSGTIFHARKLAVRDILAAIAIFVNGAKGFSALQLSRDLCVDYKTAFVMCHKVREALALSRDAAPLEGEVEIDGMYVGGYVKPANERAKRKDLRLAQHQTGKRQVIVAMRERKGRTMVGVAKREADGARLAVANIKPNSTVHADEASHWDGLAARFEIKRVNHKEAYSQDGACTNQAESFFSRLRRAEIGTHHHIAGRYLAAYAEEMAWREDHRRTPNGTQFSMTVAAVALSPASRRWSGYWQRRAS